MTFWKPEHLSACLAFCSARWEVSLFLVFLHLRLGKVSAAQKVLAGVGTVVLALQTPEAWMPEPSPLPVPAAPALGGGAAPVRVCNRCVHLPGHALRAVPLACSPQRVDLLETRLSDSRSSSFLTLPARSCSLKCWIHWQVACAFIS